MNPTIQNLTTAQLYTARFLIWDAIEEQWSAPQTLAAAREAHARDPELQAAAILPDGTTTAPAPFAEIYTRAAGPRTPRSLEESLAIRQRANRVHAQRAAALQPPPKSTGPSAREARNPAAQTSNAAGRRGKRYGKPRLCLVSCWGKISLPSPPSAR